MNELKDKVYSGGRLLKESRYYKLSGPMNSQDSNYYVHRIYHDEKYLIDSSDLNDFMVLEGYTDISSVPYKDLIEISWRAYVVSYVLDRYTQELSDKSKGGVLNG